MLLTAVQVTYAYDLALPSTLAAPIQILNTCRELAALGAEVRVLTGPLTAPVDDCLAYYGIDPHERLELVPVPWSSPAPVRRQALAEVLATDSGVRHAVVSRGEPGASLFRDLRRLAARTSRLHVYEAHRPAAAARGSRRGLRGRARAALEGPWRERLERAAIGDADGVVCLTEGVREALEQRYGIRCPVLVLPSGTAVSADGPPGDAARDLDVVYAGKLEIRKGVELVLETARLLPGCNFTVAGGSPRQAALVRERAEQLGAGGRITVPGFIPPADVRGLWRRARVAVCPLAAADPVGARFTSPLKLLEAMANGAPVVASDLPTVRPYVRDGVTGLLVEPDDPRALAEGIRRLLEDRRLAAALAKAALAEVRRHSWPQRAARLLDFLEGLPAPHGR